MVAAFAAQLALGGADAVAGVGGGFEDAHLGQRQAVFVEDAEHGVAVDDQLGHVGDGGGVGLLLA